MADVTVGTGFCGSGTWVNVAELDALRQIAELGTAEVSSTSADSFRVRSIDSNGYIRVRNAYSSTNDDALAGPFRLVRGDDEFEDIVFRNDLVV